MENRVRPAFHSDAQVAVPGDSCDYSTAAVLARIWVHHDYRVPDRQLAPDASHRRRTVVAGVQIDFKNDSSGRASS